MSTIFNRLITINAPGEDVVFDGVDFVGQGNIKLVAAKSLTVKNCRIYSGKQTVSTSNCWLLGNSAEPVKVVIENNFFGNGGVYNLVNAKNLADGSSISNNYFKKTASTHNYISIYDAEDNAVININDNVMETSDRIMFAPSAAVPKYTVNLNNNVENGEWVGTEGNPEDFSSSGMVCLQPVPQNTDLSNIIINANNNSPYLGPEAYVWYGKGATVEADKLYKIYVDGEVYSPALMGNLPTPAEADEVVEEKEQ